jgi:predicted nucleic acid-binding protein
MSLSSFLTDPSAPLVADASVIINLNATRCASEIIAAFSGKFLVTDNACVELEQGVQNGHQDHEKLARLIDSGFIRRVHMDAQSMAIYESLIDGSALQTLDDGEAATIACARAAGGVALIDERKARTLCSASFPTLMVACSAEILIHEAVAAALGKQQQADAIVSALTKARMRVPSEYIGRVVDIIGTERASSCSSLPKTSRSTSSFSERT